MAQIPLGALTTLNLSTQLDPMFTELYGVVLGLSYSAGTITLAPTSPVTSFTGLNVSNNNTTTVATSAIHIGYSASSFYGYQLANINNPTATSAGNFKLQRGTSTTWVDVLSSDNAGNISAGVDNTQTLGTAVLRWSVIYAGTGTINTSDARSKTAIQPLSPAELAAAKALSAEVGTFRFLDAVAAKGADARQHAGMTVQRAMQILQAQGLDPMRYAFICRDAWPASDDTPAGDRYGFRTDELLLFIARGFDARLAALETA